MGVEEHRHQARGVGPVGYALLTVSDSRTEATDESGRVARQLLNEAGHVEQSYRLLKNDPEAVRAEVGRLLLDGAVGFIVTTGGTGLGRRDLTIEAVRPLLDKELPGFGELFRSLSHAEIGSAALMSRALGGVSRGKIVACLPGSAGAVRLALSKLLIPELRHLVREATR